MSRALAPLGRSDFWNRFGSRIALPKECGVCTVLDGLWTTLPEAGHQPELRPSASSKWILSETKNNPPDFWNHWSRKLAWLHAVNSWEWRRARPRGTKEPRMQDPKGLLRKGWPGLYFRRHLQDGGEVRRGDHLPPHKYIKTTSTCRTTPTEHLLNTGRRPQTSQKTPSGDLHAEAGPNPKLNPRSCVNKEQKGKFLPAASGAVDQISTINLMYAVSVEYLNRQRIIPKLRWWTLGATVDLGFAFSI